MTMNVTSPNTGGYTLRIASAPAANRIGFGNAGTAAATVAEEAVKTGFKKGAFTIGSMQLGSLLGITTAGTTVGITKAIIGAGTQAIPAALGSPLGLFLAVPVSFLATLGIAPLCLRYLKYLSKMH